MQSVGSFGTSRMTIAQFLVADGTAIKVENNKIKKKSCPGMFKAISNMSTVTTLSIRSCRLKKLPAEIGLLVNLRVLKVEDNLLTEVPALDTLIELTEVNFSYNQIKVFPNSLVRLEKLVSLDLSHNPIACIPGAVSQISSLTNLRIDSTSLPYFPVSVCALPKIEELTCSGHKWGAFPEQVLQFTELRWLSLSANGMASVHAEIAKLANLTYLDLADNSITSLPKEVCTLTQLSTLLLQHNKLSQLPTDLGNLTALESLKLHDNQISALPESIGNLTSLVELYLQENELTALPPQLGECTSLRTLRLAYNKLTTIPDTFSKLAKLNLLMVHDNQFTEVPKVLSQARFLKHLLRVTLHNNHFPEMIQNDINVMGAIHFLQEMYVEATPTTLRKQLRDRSIRRNTSRGHITRTHNRVPGLSLRSSTGSGDSNDSSPDDIEVVSVRPKLPKEPSSITTKLKVQARRRAISVGEAIPQHSNESDSDSDTEYRPWKSQMEFRMRSGSVPNGASAIPPYRAFQRVYEYLVEQLDLSEKRRDLVNALPHEEKWKLLSHMSRESSLNLLVNTKPRSAPVSPNIISSPQRSPSNLILSSPGSAPSSPGLTSPSKAPRAPVFLNSNMRSPSNSNLHTPRHSENIRATRELLTTQSVAWITTFAETGGIESILQGLSSLSTKKSKTDEEYYYILEYLSCITIMIGIGLESLLISNAVEVVVLNVDSEHLGVKEATISVLDEVCNVFYSGQGLVIDALTKISSDSTAFLPICNTLNNSGVAINMKAVCMKLINNLITNTDELESRCRVRNSFLKLGLQDNIAQFRKYAGDEYQRLEQQIDHFEEVMNDDGEEIVLRFKQGQSYGKELLLSSFGVQTPRELTTSAMQQVPVRVVLPGVSHAHMSCMVAQPQCDATTTAHDLISTLLKDHDQDLGTDAVRDKAAYGIYVVNGSKASHGVNEKVDSTGGFFLDDARYILPLAIDHVILVLRLRPWTISVVVDQPIYDLLLSPSTPPTPKSLPLPPGGAKPLPVVPEIQMEVEPKGTCGALLLQVLVKLFGERPLDREAEELAFFMEKKAEKNGKPVSASAGVWLESTAKLSDYGIEVTKAKLQLKKMPKMLKIIMADDSFEYVGYEEDTPIRSILHDTFQRLVAPSLTRGNVPSSSHYGLYYIPFTAEPDAGEWLDPDRTLRSYHLPNRVPLKYALRPRLLNIQFMPPPNFQGVPPTFSNPLRVHFYSPIGGVLEKLGVPLEGCGIYLQSETGNQYLDPNLSLFNQGVPENSSLIIEQATRKEEPAASVHIWEEPENANTIVYNVDNFNEIHAATINKLVERLTSEKDHDPDFTQVFEATYRSFTTHETLFSKLVERYIPPEHIPEPPALNVVRLRVIVFLKNWIEHCGPDIPMSVMLSIEKFIDTQLCKGGHMNLAAQLRKMIQNWKVQHENESPREATEVPLYQMNNPTKIIHMASSLVDEWGLALQMTIRESRLFAQIMPVEFFKQKGNDPIVAQMINNFNRVAAWVPVAVLSEIKLVHRANTVEKFIKLAWNLRQLNNFHLLTAVLSGLSNSAVLRLKWTFAKVAKRYKQMLEELEATMGMEGSFKVYRNTLVNATPPCVPYIGVYLTDLVFIEDGNPDKVGNMINWTKRRFMYNIISTFQRYQMSQYDEKQPSPSSPTHAMGNSNSHRLSDNKEGNINMFLTFLNRMPILTDKQLFEMSLTREPRNADRRELM